MSRRYRKALEIDTYAQVEITRADVAVKVVVMIIGIFAACNVCQTDVIAELQIEVLVGGAASQPYTSVETVEMAV